MKEKRKWAVVLACSLIFAQSISAFTTDTAEAKSVQTITLYRGKSIQLTTTYKGKKRKTGKKYRYLVANKKIASVSAKGKLKAKKAGTTKITLQKKTTGKKSKIKVKVVDYVKELRITGASNLMMKEGSSRNLQAAVYPRTAKNRKVGYSSSDRETVMVSADGRIQALQSGFATITVTTKGITKKGKKITKKLYIYVSGNTSPVPTPHAPSGGGTVINDVPGTGGPTTVPTAGPTEKPKTLEQAIKEIPTPDSSTLLAAHFVVKDSVGTSTLYFVNRNYQGEMHVSVDGMDMASSSGVTNVMHRLATEVTGKGVSVSVNPGNKQENKYYDANLGLWRDILLVSRPDTASAWLIQNRKSGQQYRLTAWEKDEKYGTPYGVILTDGDTASKIIVY